MCETVAVFILQSIAVRKVLETVTRGPVSAQMATNNTTRTKKTKSDWPQSKTITFLQKTKRGKEREIR